MAISNNSTGIRPGVCTSTTRPTAPYEGQHIYETDTDIEYVWSGSAWVVNYVSAASPAFTGTPTAPTAADGTNTTQLATTAHVQTALGSWQYWTPTVTAYSGTITSGSLNMARYIQIKKLVIATFSYTITTAGTAAGSLLKFTFPVTPSSVVFDGMALGNGREFGAVGFDLVSFKLGGTVVLTNSSGAGWMQNGYAGSVTIAYEAA